MKLRRSVPTWRRRTAVTAHRGGVLWECGGTSEVRRKPSWCGCTGRMDSRSRSVGARRTVKGRELAWKPFGEGSAFDFGSARKSFWQTIRRRRGRNQGVVGNVKSKDRPLLTDERDLHPLEREHFSEMLNRVQGIEMG